VLHPFLQKMQSLYLVIPVICGIFTQKEIVVNERTLTVGVISRRSRFCSGPRFLRRGINYQGDVANEVETELFTYEMENYSD
jgi:phosphatidylinositol 3,5-bisphosphate 5-phosphatase